MREITLDSRKNGELTNRTVTNNLNLNWLRSLGKKNVYCPISLLIVDTIENETRVYRDESGLSHLSREEFRGEEMTAWPKLATRGETKARMVC
jgi:hypothetical protein